MAEEILDSHEQGEAVRKWLEKNASSIIIGLLVGLGAVFGYKRWEESQTSHQGEAMSQFEQMAAPDIDAETFDAHFQALTTSYADTPFAGLAVLAKADRSSDAGDLEATLAQLRVAADKASPIGVQVVAQLRLARALIAAEQADEALRQLNAIKVSGFKAAIAEVRGDALAKQGKLDEAKTAYEDALSHMDVSTPGRDVVEIKRDNLSQPLVAQSESAAPETPPVVPAESAPETPETATTSEDEASS